MILEATGIRGGYGGADVLHDVGLRLEPGTFVGLIGQNGCGKSTFLRMLSGVMPIRGGTVTVDGVGLKSLTQLEIAKRIAFVPQTESATFEFSVRDIVLMGRYPHRGRGRGETTADFDAVNTAMEAADVAALADRPVTQLSGGEHRRVLIARALAQDTPLLLLDEPTAHLDVTHQVAIMLLVQQWRATRGVGAIAALHDLDQAAEYCDHLLLMHHGRIIACGAPAAVLTADNLKIAYEADARVATNPFSGRPHILSLRPAAGAAGRSSARHVHVFCGAGSGVETLGALVRAGYRVTAGVLDRMDGDRDAAEALGIECVAEAPFTPIGPTARAACEALAATAEIVIIADVPFGGGNVANLEIAAAAQTAGSRVIILGARDLVSRDFTGGHASTLLTTILANGAARLNRIEEMPDFVGPRSNPDGIGGGEA